jgi:hypothetical protein
MIVFVQSDFVKKKVFFKTSRNVKKSQNWLYHTHDVYAPAKLDYGNFGIAITFCMLNVLSPIPSLWEGHEVF